MDKAELAPQLGPVSRFVPGATPPLTGVVVGASGGIGAGFVRQIAADPAVARVFAASRSTAGMDRNGAAEVIGLEVDVTRESTLEAAVREIRSRVDSIDFIINCAGLLHDADAGMRPERRLDDVDPHILARSFAVNASGVLLLAKHFAPLLPRREPCLFASLSARVGSIGDNRRGGWYGYRASKAAQNMIVKTLSIELRRRSAGIICVALHPGTVDTALSEPFQRGVPAGQLFSPGRAARQLLDVMARLTPDDNGGFFAWDGQPVEW